MRVQPCFAARSSSLYAGFVALKTGLLLALRGAGNRRVLGGLTSGPARLFNKLPYLNVQKGIGKRDDGTQPVENCIDEILTDADA